MLLLLLLSHFSRVRLSAIPGTVAHQAPLSMGFSKQKYWSGLPIPSPGDHVPVLWLILKPGFFPHDLSSVPGFCSNSRQHKCLALLKVSVSRSVVSDFMTPWTVAHQAPLFMGFSKQEYCSGLLSPAPGDLLHVGIKPAPPTSPALAGRFFIASAMGVKGG